MPRVKRKSRIGKLQKFYWLKKSDPVDKLSVVHDQPLTGRFEDFFILSGETFDRGNNEISTEVVDSDGYKADEFFVILDKPYKYCTATNLDEFVANKLSCVFSDLREVCKRHIQDIGKFTYMSQCKDVMFIELYDSDTHCPTPRIKSCVTIGQDLTVSVHIHGRPLGDSHTIWERIGHKCYTLESIINVLNELSKFDICSGNQDTDLQDIVPVGTYNDIVKPGYKYQGYRETFFIGSTIRSTQCSLIIASRSSRCGHCSTYRRTLRKSLMRCQNSPNLATEHIDWTKSRVRNSNLTEKQKILKIKQLRNILQI